MICMGSCPAGCGGGRTMLAHFGGPETIAFSQASRARPSVLLGRA
jgi:hypothetical protein